MESACPLSAVHPHKRFTNSIADSQQTVVLEEQDIIVSKVLGEALALGHIKGNTLIFVITRCRQNGEGLLRERQEAVLLRSDTYTRLCMGMNDACVIHTHTQAGVGVATQKNGLLPLTQQSLAVLATTSYHEYEGIAFDMSERERLAQDLGNNNVLFLKNHGLLTVGNTVGEAFMWMYRAERACRFQLAFQQAGVEATKISEEMQKITMDRNRQANSKDGYRPIGQKEWPALLRKLDRENPGYDA